MEAHTALGNIGNEAVVLLALGPKMIAATRPR